MHTGHDSAEFTDVAEAGTDLIHPDDFEALGSSFAESSERPGEPIPVRYRTLHADGSWRLFEVTHTNLLQDELRIAARGGVISAGECEQLLARLVLIIDQALSAD